MQMPLAAYVVVLVINLCLKASDAIQQSAQLNAEMHLLVNKVSGNADQRSPTVVFNYSTNKKQDIHMEF
jgi:hypothetical protein